MAKKEIFILSAAEKRADEERTRNKEEVRKTLNQQIEEFFAAGNTATECPPTPERPVSKRIKCDHLI